MIRLGINGYGRIGRNVHRLLLDNPDICVVAVNSRSDAEMRAHLLKHDSLHGTLSNDISAGENEFFVDGKRVASLSVKNAADVPWHEYGVDIVLESTGHAKTSALAKQHLQKGVHTVLVSAPMKDDTPTIVLGVNESILQKQPRVLSNASCTTNCIAPVLNILSRSFGIENAFVTSIHSFTNSQNLLDNSGRDLRRARSTTENIIPTTTGSIAAIGHILPNLKGKIDGLAFRVPTPTVSIADMRLVFETKTSAEEINTLLRDASKTDRYRGIVGVCDEPLVSADFRTDTHSGIVDSELTKVVGGKYAQLQVWYDNEWGYAARLIEVLTKLATGKPNT